MSLDEGPQEKPLRGSESRFFRAAGLFSCSGHRQPRGWPCFSFAVVTRLPRARLVACLDTSAERGHTVHISVCDLTPGFLFFCVVCIILSRCKYIADGAECTQNVK